MTGTRQVRFDDWDDTHLYDRSAWARGRRGGPAVVEEFSSTVPIRCRPGSPPAWTRFGNLLSAVRRRA